MNYKLMKESEQELQAEFIKFCEHIYVTWTFLYKSIKDKQADATTMDEVFRMEDISNHFEAQIQDDCIWSISKNEPLANHLRYIVAILNSVKDLERMGDYAVSAIRFFANNQVSDEIRNLIVAILKEALTGMNKVINSLKVKPATDTYQICRAAHTLFKKRYSKMLEQLSGILKNRSVEQIEKLFQGAIIIIKHIERLMDHLANISENFVFIKQPDLFFTKQSKQKNK